MTVCGQSIELEGEEELRVWISVQVSRTLLCRFDTKRKVSTITKVYIYVCVYTYMCTVCINIC